MYSNLMQDQQVRRYSIILFSLSLFLVAASILFCGSVTNDVKAMLLHHDETVAASLTAQGIPDTVIAKAFTDTNVIYDADKMQKGTDILSKIGIRPALEIQFLPQLFQNGIFHFEDVAVSLVTDMGNPLIGILPNSTIVQYFFMNIF